MTKFSFTLKNINIYEVEKKYNISTLSFSTTKISELASTPVTTNYTFVDETMRSYSYVISMSKLLNKELPLSTNIHCFWCRHPFTNPPIGCPIKYIPSILYKTYYSELSKDIYSIKGSVTPNMQKSCKNCDQIDKKDYYITDGIFCSFNCCLAFINNTNDKLYHDSLNLLLQYFYCFFDKSIIIEPAMSWRLLENCGGHLSITQFRENFNTINYINLHETIESIPTFKTLGFLFEKKIKF